MFRRRSTCTGARSGAGDRAGSIVSSEAPEPPAKQPKETSVACASVRASRQEKGEASSCADMNLQADARVQLKGGPRLALLRPEHFGAAGRADGDLHIDVLVLQIDVPHRQADDAAFR